MVYCYQMNTLKGKLSRERVDEKVYHNHPFSVTRNRCPYQHLYSPRSCYKEDGIKKSEKISINAFFSSLCRGIRHQDKNWRKMREWMKMNIIIMPYNRGTRNEKKKKKKSKYDYCFTQFENENEKDLCLLSHNFHSYLIKCKFYFFSCVFYVKRYLSCSIL